MAAARQSVAEKVTARMIAQLEAGTIPWSKPWAAGMPRNALTGRHYSGVNLFLLAHAPDDQFATYKQVAEAGGQVRKGSTGLPVVFYGAHVAKAERERVEQAAAEGEQVTPRGYRVAKAFTVFGLSQCDGVEHLVVEREHHDWTPVDRAQSVADAYLARPSAPTLSVGGLRACYSPSADVVTMPDRDRFDSAESWHATVFHEITHSTGHPGRLARPGVTGGALFASDTYSREELVAEMGAAILCAESDIEAETTWQRSAAYVASWLAVLRGDPSLVMTAAAAAARATALILGRDQADA